MEAANSDKCVPPYSIELGNVEMNQAPIGFIQRTPTSFEYPQQLNVPLQPPMAANETQDINLPPIGFIQPMPAPFEYPQPPPEYSQHSFGPPPPMYQPQETYSQGNYGNAHNVVTVTPVVPVLNVDAMRKRRMIRFISGFFFVLCLSNMIYFSVYY